MRSSLLLSCSKSISVRKSAISWPSFERCLMMWRCLIFSFTGLSSSKLLLREDGFALIVNLSVLESWSKGRGGMIKLIWLLDSRLQLQ